VCVAAEHPVQHKIRIYTLIVLQSTEGINIENNRMAGCCGGKSNMKVAKGKHCNKFQQVLLKKIFAKIKE